MEETFGPYRIEQLLGRGGMGEVHRAVDTRRGRTVALKRLPAPLADDPGFQARFRREAELTVGLREPHIVPIHDYGEIDGRLFLDMRLVEGTDLATVLTRGAMPVRRAVDVVAQVAEALDAAHGAGLVHRDVKPSNVLLTGNDHVQLIDFGLARAAADAHLTTTGSTYGTLAYMAPERFTRATDGPPGDVYALGCLLHEMLTGSRPFPQTDGPRLMYAHLQNPPPDPADVDPGLAAFRAVLGRALAKEPADRYATAGELAAAARMALDAPPPRPVPAGETAPRDRPAGPEPEDERSRRRWLPAAIALLLVAAVVAVVVVVARHGTSASGPAPVALPPPAPELRPVPVRVSPVAQTAGVEDVVAAPDGRRAYTAGLSAPGAFAGQTYRLTVVDVDRAEVRASVPLPDESTLAISPDGRRVYAAAHSGTITVLDTDRLVPEGTIPVGPYISTLVVAPDGHRGYARYDGGVAVLDLDRDTVVTTIPIKALAMAVAADGRHLWALTDDGLTRSLTGVDTATDAVVSRDRTNPSDETLLASPDGHLYVMGQNNSVGILDAATGAAEGYLVVDSASQPELALTGDGRTLFVRRDTTVAVGDTARRAVVRTLDVGLVTGPIAVTPDGGHLLVEQGNDLAVVDTG